MRRPPGPPPWLWLLTGLYLSQVPATVTWWTAQAKDLLGLGAYPEQVTTTGGFRALLALSVAQLAPTAFLLAGILALPLPRLRCRFTEWRHDLRRPLPGEPFAEIQRFLADRAPGVELRVSPTRSDLTARVYPAGPRATRIAVFVPLTVLWRRDRAAAETLLLHELGHHRNGEQHVAGLGSPFVALLRSWPYVFALCGLLPAGLLLVSGEPSAHLMFAQVVLVLLRVPEVLLLPVGALWSAELAADRHAAAARGGAAQGGAELLRVLAAVEEADTGRLAALHHPPARLRRWFARRAGSPSAQLLLVALLPLALLADLLLTVAGATVAYRLLDVPWERAAGRALSLADHQVTAGPEWWAVLAVLAVWPLLAPVWPRLWAPDGRPGGRLSPGPYATAVLVPALVLAVALAPWGSTADPVAAKAPAPAPPADPVATAAPPPATDPTGQPTGTAMATATACPTPSPPAAPARPTGLPAPATAAGELPATDPAAVPPGTFRTARVVSAEPLLGTPRQLVDEVADRLSGARWTLAADGTLTDDTGEPPLRRTGGLHGEKHTTTEVSATAVWTDADLRPAPDADGLRLVLVRAATGVNHAVIACRAFDATTTTAGVFVLELSPTP
ncbi:hypothetical protein ACIPYS_04515 [Kitasatospora sp. NPDC089913]|uniref:hypothetical protein n=1 Tax=Kitasatospora sp. NPDC089913 TaxID=3364080 RepID=UPI0037FF678C